MAVSCALTSSDPGIRPNYEVVLRGRRAVLRTDRADVDSVQDQHVFATAHDCALADRALFRDDEWLYIKFYVGSHLDRLDDLIVSALAPIVTETRPKQWFFIRYYDSGGPHLRIRLRCPRSESKACFFLAKEICKRALEGLSAQKQFAYKPFFPKPAHSASSLAHVPHVCRARYAREFSFYGGDRGVELAEEVFHVSSQIALAALRVESKGQLNRKCVILDLMLHVDLKRLGANKRFWRVYADYWLSIAQIAQPEIWRKRFLRNHDALVFVGETRKRGSTNAQYRNRWNEALERANAAHHQIFSEPMPLAKLASFIHLMNNRLGVSLIEEAYLATLLEAEAYEATVTSC